MSKDYVEVAPFTPLSGPKQVFTYHLGPHSSSSIKVGSLVQIPWRSRQLQGVVLAYAHGPLPYRTKACRAAAGGGFLTTSQIEFARWISTALCGNLGYTLRLFAPPLTTPLTLTLPSSGPVAPITSAVDVKVVSTPRLLDRLLVRLSRQASHLRRPTLLLVATQQRAEELFAQLPAAVQSQAHLFHANKPKPFLQKVWQSVFNQEVSLIVGTHKALYLPFHALEQIIVDQEEWAAHQPFKQYPLLHNRDAALAFAKIHHASLLFVTTQPSVFLYHQLKRQHPSSPLKPLPDTTPNFQLISPDLHDRRQRALIPRELLTNLRRWHQLKQSLLLVYNGDLKPLKRALKKSLPTSAIVTRLNARTQQALGSPPLVVATTAVFSLLPRERFSRVIWLYPERSFFPPSYRTAENLYHLLGRLLNYRQRSSSSLLIVTRTPLRLQQLFSSSSPAFLESQLKLRYKYSLPPVTELVKLTSQRQLLSLRQKLAARLLTHPDARLYGPLPTSTLILTGTNLSPLYQDLPFDRAEITSA
jgi:primosomal protein N'